MIKENREKLPKEIAEKITSVQPMPDIDMEKLGEELEIFFGERKKRCIYTFVQQK